MVVNQIKVHAVSHMVLKDGSSISTCCYDENNNPISFSEFKDYQRVMVTGYMARDGYMFAEKITRQKMTAHDVLGPSVIPQ
jgi:hypothetical protein